MIFVAWGITGAGHFLFDSFDVMTRLASTPSIRVTTYLTKAGFEIVRVYGLWEKLKKVSNGSYYSEIISEEDDGYSSPSAGRLMRGKYAVLAVAPSSANTTAKIVHGISDTLVTNAVAQAMKGRTPVLILPSEESKNIIETTLPHRIEPEACLGCEPCPAAQSCPSAAISRTDTGKMRISLHKCTACGICITACARGAARFRETALVSTRQMDIDIVKKLSKTKGLNVVENPRALEEKLSQLLGGVSF